MQSQAEKKKGTVSYPRRLESSILCLLGCGLLCLFAQCHVIYTS